MSTLDPRDRSVEHLLRQSSGSLSVSDQCVEGETLAAWVEGALPQASAASVENHLADCARCQALLAAFVRSEPSIAAGRSEPATRWWHLRWLVPLATAATAIALWVSIPAPVDRSTPLPPVAEQERGAASQYVPSSEAPLPQLSSPTPLAPAQSTSSLERELDRSAEKRPATDALSDSTRKANEESGQKPATLAKPAEPDDLERRERVEASRYNAPAPPASPAAARRDAATESVTVVIPVEIISPDRAFRWRILNGNSLDRSVDGGATWSPVAIVPGGTFVAGHAPSASVAWVVGRAGVIRVTTNGAQFESVAFPEAIDLVSVIAVDDRQATVTTADGRRFSTSDRGATWTAP